MTVKIGDEVTFEVRYVANGTKFDEFHGKIVDVADQIVRVAVRDKLGARGDIRTLYKRDLREDGADRWRCPAPIKIGGA